MRRVQRIAVAQLRTTSCRPSNLATIERLLGEAKSLGAEMVFLPENADFIAQGTKATLELSEPLEGATMDWFRQRARQHTMWINIGSLHERLCGDNEGKIANTQVLLSPAGDVAAVYRKAHLFDVDVPGGRSYRESALTAPGTEHVVCDTPVGRVGLTTCYDLRFPAQYAELARGSCDVVTVPSAFMVPTGQAHWEVLLRARAVDTQCFFVASAQCGAHNEARSSYGHSMVVDPWGRVLLDMGLQEDVVEAVDLEYSTLVDTRARLPLRDHARAMTWPGDGEPPAPAACASVPRAADRPACENPEVL